MITLALVDAVVPVLWSIPWVVVPAITLYRASRSRTLDDESPGIPADAPSVSIVLPARNERRNIERCVRSLLSTIYPACEVIVVDDHSTDDTADLARTAGAGDPRLRVVSAPPLPDGWLGKQWACFTGAGVAHGEFILFTDADTTHAPDLLARAVNAARRERADLFSVAGEQEMQTFWERIIQPQVFAILSARFGGTEHVSRVRRPADAIANGQFLLFPRAAYDALGTHAAVHDRAAEDLALAQECVRSGRRLAMQMAGQRLRTRMYASLSELIGGWRKNMYAAGRHAMIGGRVGQALFPLVLLVPSAFQLAPVVLLALAAAAVLSVPWLVWASLCVAVMAVYFVVLYAYMRAPVWYAALFPLGAAMVLYIAIGAVLRGSRIEWKERRYVAR